MRVSFLWFIPIIVLCRLVCAAQPPSVVQDQIRKLMPQPVPTAPNVASLGKYGDYPVSYYTGIPEISIPLFEVRSGSLTVPITLSYHASGVKPTDIASWVGMGWSLSAGGQISRNIRGKRDEEYYFTNALNSNPSVCGTYQYLNQAATGVSDADPDVFSYSFPGKSGKFMLPPNGSVTNSPLNLIPYAPIMIKRVHEYKYEVTDENGVLYRFGTNAAGTTASDATSSTSGGNPTLNAITALHLMEMTAPNSNDQISFNYQSNGTAYTKDVSYVFSVLDQCVVSNGGQCPSQPSLPQLLNIDSYTSQNVLSTIFFETGKVEFILGAVRNDYIQQLSLATGKSLSQIKIWSKINDSYVLQKTVSFIYNYFKNANNNDEALKLEEVRFLDSTSDVVQRYKFSYFTDSFSWNRTNSNFLNARDLWGYYNGATQNTDLILPQTVDYALPGGATTTSYSFGGAVNRTVNEQLIKEGVLSTITFPTGGNTQFDYEPNKYLDNANNPATVKLAGGLRIAKITSSDGSTSVPVVKTYKYGNAESGYGVPNFTDRQFTYSNTQMVYSDCQVQNPITNYRSRTYYSNSAYNQDSFDSSPLRYNYVTEYTGDPSGVINGKIAYVFDDGTSASDVDLVVPSSSKYFRNSYAWKRGKLTSKTVYNTSNQVVSSTTIHYTPFQQVSTLVGYGVAQYITGNNSTCSGYTCQNEAGDWINPQTFFFTSYYQNSGAIVEDGTAETTFESGGSLKSITSSVSRTIDASKLQVLQESVARSTTSELTVSVRTYPFQLSANASSAGAAEGIYLLNNKNILTVPIETYTMVQNTDGTNQRVLSAQVTTYRKNTANTNYVVPDQIYLLEVADPIALTSYGSVAVNGTNDGLTMNGNLKPRINLTAYDNDGNLQAVTRNNDLAMAYVYGYNNSLPTVQAGNALPAEVKTQNFEDLATSSTIIHSATAHTGNQYYLGDYTMSFTLPNARTYVIDYWYLNTSNKWQYISKLYTGASMTLTEGSAIDDVRIYPQDAQIASFTYEPLLGKTSETDTNGRTVFYEYDAFGRLKLVRDVDGNVIKAYDYHYVIQN